ncbi:hypothetical protein EDD16DRAFT_335906 [Pisolithus croceorrhizus]|nr:hypothetical protein EDD16DRAFT_335906 [Pisolithus croceorrhizus]KAI6167133.1 hypothetical protein EDD17DRAFT_1110172 [Pisolithus thermaeus]
MLERRRGLAKCSSARLSSERTDHGRLWILGLPDLGHAQSLFGLFMPVCRFRGCAYTECALTSAQVSAFQAYVHVRFHPDSLGAVCGLFGALRISPTRHFLTQSCVPWTVPSANATQLGMLGLGMESSNVTLHNNTGMASWWLVRWNYSWGCGGPSNVGTYKKVLVSGHCSCHSRARPSLALSDMATRPWGISTRLCTINLVFP